MTGKSATDVKDSAANWIGLFLSLFGMLIIRQAFRFLAPSITTTPMALNDSIRDCGAWVRWSLLIIFSAPGFLRI